MLFVECLLINYQLRFFLHNFAHGHKCLRMQIQATRDSILTAIFPGELGLAGFIEAKDDGSDGNNWSYRSCKAPVKSSPPTNLHPTFYRPDALPVAQSTVSKH